MDKFTTTQVLTFSQVEMCSRGKICPALQTIRHRLKLKDFMILRLLLLQVIELETEIQVLMPKTGDKHSIVHCK